MQMITVLDQVLGENFALYNADCVDVARALPDESIDFMVFSPPFASLYTYSNSDRDMGNSRSFDEFFTRFKFLVLELFRILTSGRLVCVHVMNLTTTKQIHGQIGLRDFRGEIVRLFQDCGFIFHSELTVGKDPVVQMQRTKAIGLLWKQIKKDSSLSRQGLPDYVVTFRKPGENPKPISHTAEEFPVSEWQHLAHPCWMDIRQSNTLNRKLARDNDDERHIVPLQLDLIAKLLRLWSSPGDVVFSSFAGIGSEGYEALRMGRRFIGTELKRSYFELAAKNLSEADRGIFEPEKKPRATAFVAPPAPPESERLKELSEAQLKFRSCDASPDS
jgi:DNA modification methylase